MSDSIQPNYNRFFIYIIVIVILIIGAVFLFSKPNDTTPVTNQTSENSSSPSASMKSKQYPSAPKMTIDTKKKYQAIISTTKGKIVADLFADETPVTVNNFVFLARDGYYDNTVFHRVIKGFMIQGGDPNGNGTGDPGYKFADEKITRDYKRGILAMANSGPDTNGSQFFIMHQDYNLPKNYVIFGTVSQGLDVVDAIAETPVTDNGQGEQSKPVTPITVTSVSITEK
jgi:cyclophilin family peptidyl-prolyl cis-trans isomerase